MPCSSDSSIIISISRVSFLRPCDSRRDSRGRIGNHANETLGSATNDRWCSSDDWRKFVIVSNFGGYSGECVDLEDDLEIARRVDFRKAINRVFSVGIVFSVFLKRLSRETVRASLRDRENRRFKLSSRVTFPLTLAYQIYGPRRLSLIRFNSSPFREWTRLCRAILNEFTPIPCTFFFL